MGEKVLINHTISLIFTIVICQIDGFIIGNSHVDRVELYLFDYLILLLICCLLHEPVRKKQKLRIIYRLLYGITIFAIWHSFSLSMQVAKKITINKNLESITVIIFFISMFIFAILSLINIKVELNEIEDSET